MHVNSPDSENKKLLYHCAVSLESDFGFNETSHDANGVPFSLWNYWGFNSGTVKYMNDYLTTWTSLLRNEIDNGRPIYYCGTDITVSPNKAHAWVVDGYRTSDNKYHCNWGWGGQYNEWFTLTNLIPGSSNFNSSQCAIMNIYPKLDACSGLTGESIICYPDTVQYSINKPSTASVTWSVTGNLAVVGSNTSPTCNVRSTSNTGASGTITATLKNSQGQTFLNRSKKVWVGIPNNSQIDMTVMFGQSPYNILCTNTEQIIVAGHTNTQQQGIDSYYWDFGSWASYHTGYDLGGITNSRPTFYLSGYPPTSQVIKVAAHNQCGHSMTYAKSITFYAQNCFGYRLVFSPNPAIDETTMTIETTSPEESVDQAVVWEMEVYDPAQNLKDKKIKIKGDSTKLHTSGWKEGIYIVRVKYKDEILTGKLVVKK